MRKLKFIVFIFTMITLTTVLQSCLDDSEQQFDSLVISTINVPNPDSKDFYFTLDNGKKMFPGDSRWIGNYKLIDGQRAFVIFNKLNEKVEGYDYNIEIKQIKDILTKDIITMGEGENTEEKIGDDKINTTYIWMSQDTKYLSIEFQYLGTHIEDKKHFLNLVIVPTPEPIEGTDEEYLELEFRHNAQGDSPARLGEGYVSFKINEQIKQMANGKKGLRIRVNTIYNGIKYYNIDFPSIK